MYKRHDKTLPLLESVLSSSRVPDELWIMCEASDDAEVALDALHKIGAKGVGVTVLNTPMINGKYEVIPYSHKINWALDRTLADIICYIDNGSFPSVDKYKVMSQALEENPSFGAVYCSQQRSGTDNRTSWADSICNDAYTVLNYTQVMHRRTPDRWNLDMRNSNPDVADAIFWRDLHKSIGSFHPVDGARIHDWHQIESYAAQGTE